jgi:hypothetical protein
MKVEGRDPVEQPQPVGFALDLDRGGRAVRRGGRPEPVAVIDRYAEGIQDRAGEAAEALLGRDRGIPVMAELELRVVADVVVRRDDQQVARNLEEPPQRIDLRRGGPLARPREYGGLPPGVARREARGVGAFSRPP